MAEHKNQHFLPEMLQRRFATDIDQRQISLIHLRSKTVKTGPIDGQGSKDYFYGKDLVLEKSFISIEGAATTLLNDIEAGRIPAERSKEHSLLAFFIALQWCRTPAAAVEVNATTDAMAQAIVAGHHKRGLLAPDSEMAEFKVTKKNAVSDAVKLVPDCYPALLDLKIAVLRNETNVEYILSDLGASFHNQWRQIDKSQGYVGFGERGVQVFFAISPRCLVLLYDEEVYSVGRRRNPVVVLTNRSDVIQLNKVQAESSSSCVYFTGDAPTSDAVLSDLRLDAPRIASHQHRVTTSDDGNSDLIHMFRRAPSVDINVGAISTLASAFMRSPQPGEILIRDWPHHFHEGRSAERRLDEE